MSVTINNPKLTPLNSVVSYNPDKITPAATIISLGNNTYKVFAVCYVPTQGLVGKSLDVYNTAEYKNDQGKIFTPKQTISLQGGDSAATIVLSYFDDINIDVNDTSSGATEEIQGTARTFSLGYDYVPTTGDDGTIEYPCNVVALEFDYKINDASSRNFLFVTQTDIDPRIGRGGVSVGTSPK